jgi:prevent-host-death family protein
MRTIGIRDLKAHLTDVLREVRENDQEFVVTYRGQRIARLIPETSEQAAIDRDALWSEMNRLAEEIGHDWTRGVSAAEAVAKDRRDV